MKLIKNLRTAAAVLICSILALFAHNAQSQIQFEPCITDALGNVYLTGETNSTANIGANGHQNNWDGYYDTFLVKFDGDESCPITASCKSFTLNLSASGTAILSPEDVNAGSTVSCGTPILSLSQTEFDCADVGTNTVTLTVTDENGNFETCSSQVTVIGGTSCFECTDAIILECPFTEATYTYDEGAVSYSIYQAPCLPDQGASLLRDLWFTFNADGNTEFSFEASQANFGLIVYSGTCGDLEIYDCAESQDNTSTYWVPFFTTGV